MVHAMYPSRIINSKLYPAHLGIEWLVGYTNNRDDRLIIKSKSDKTSEDFQEVEVLKLALNGGGYGKTGEDTNWQYDPLVKYTTTIQCQLDILLLADMLWETGVIQIESGNTDGINILYDKCHNDLIESICSKWETITKSELETTEYSKVVRTSVNDYMAVKPNGSIKFKGDFEVDKELHKNHSQKIVPIALREYFINNIPIENTIYKHKDIFDFCKVVKSKGGAKYIDRHVAPNGHISEFKLQKVNRYIVSSNGSKLIKILPPLYDENGNNKRDKLAKFRREHPLQLDIFNEIPDVKVDKDRESEVEAGWKTTILNNIGSKKIEDYDINYKYYINEVKKIVNQIK